MTKKAIRVCLLAGVAFVLVGTALADTVQMTVNGNKLCFVVTAGPDGRQPSDHRDIYDFHVTVGDGTIVSHSSPTGWGGSHGKRSAKWETTTNPIRFRRQASTGRFCIRIDGGTHVSWRTTGKGGGTIASGVINIP